MKATTVVLEPDFCSLWLRPERKSRDKECDSTLETCILTSQRFNKHVNTLVPELVSPGGEHVDGVFQIKVVVSVEVTTNEFVDLLLGHCVQVLEFVHGRKLFHVQTVRQDTIC